MKETDLAQHFVEYLSCFDLYFEVDYHRSVDIVAIAEKYSIAVEVKTSFNFCVLEQAIENAKNFNYSYIAVPSFHGVNWGIQRKLCKDYGIGLLVYDTYKHGNYHTVTEAVKPKLNRYAKLSQIKLRVSEKNKKCIPGSKNGESEKITAFSLTVDNLTKYVRRHPDCTLKEATQEISHHYRTNEIAKSSLYQWIRKGVIKNIALEDGKLRIIKSLN